MFPRGASSDDGSSLFFFRHAVDSSSFLIIVLVRVRLSISTSARVVFIPVLIPNLTTALSASILPALGKTLIQIRPNHALVQLCAANVLHAVQRILVGVILDEAEAAGRLLEAVEAHDEALDFAALAEQLVYLLFGGVEREVADVERGSVFQLVLGLRRGLTVQLLVASAASPLLLYMLVLCIS
jgi:hypothetical protein